jgi:hypothetical protein
LAPLGEGNLAAVPGPPIGDGYLHLAAILRSLSGIDSAGNMLS